VNYNINILLRTLFILLIVPCIGYRQWTGRTT